MDVAIALFAILSYQSPESGNGRQPSQLSAYGDDKAARSMLTVDLTDVSDFAYGRSVR